MVDRIVGEEFASAEKRQRPLKECDGDTE